MLDAIATVDLLAIECPSGFDGGRDKCYFVNGLLRDC